MFGPGKRRFRNVGMHSFLGRGDRRRKATVMVNFTHQLNAESW